MNGPQVPDDKRVHIFDTTLRDGEQSPGISLNTHEKVEIAQQLARLGVDVIEAGFPITSPGDFEAVQAIGARVEGPVICGLARTHKADIDAARHEDLFFANDTLFSHLRKFFFKKSIAISKAISRAVPSPFGGLHSSREPTTFAKLPRWF